MTYVVEGTRIRRLNREPERRGRFVLYWMQQSQRAAHNPALEVAIERANELRLPVIVGFGLLAAYPGANLRHHRFLLEGLQETEAALAARGVPLVVRRGGPAEVALALAKDAAAVVCDRGYLRHQRAWRRAIAEGSGCEVLEVEGDAVVPVEVASGKAEWAARTLRPKIGRHLDAYLRELPPTPLDRTIERPPPGLALDDLDDLVADMPVDRTVPAVSWHTRGGTSEAHRRLARFLEERLVAYPEKRNQPQSEFTSGLSPYLHFGQISPVEIALAVRDRGGPGADAFLEELVVRRELAINFVHHTPAYDRWEALPRWARATLEEHRADPRPHVYRLDDLEAATTHDPYWNAAMREMKATGSMHNHMRMYWGKKILEWTADPREAWRTTMALNDRWFLDGRDPSSWANVGWIYGLHDRPWAERSIFGTVRTMTAGGLERKTDPEAYIAKVERLEAAARRAAGGAAAARKR